MPLCKAVHREGYTEPTPIQSQAIPPLLDGRDVLGCAQTGTGKTAAFALPVLQRLAQASSRAGKPVIRALVLTPTRELAAQIGDSFAVYGEYLAAKHTVIFGGVNENPQIRALRGGVDILVATPGRLLDLHGRGFIKLGQVEFFVLDEADRMLDMGFVHDVRRVLAVLPKVRQNLLFSATMPASIVSLAGSFLRDPVHVEVTPQSSTVELVDQYVMFVERTDKTRLLAMLLKEKGTERAIVFTRTKHGANRLARKLDRAAIRCAAIHGNKSQGARNRALDSFRNGTVQVLIATDIAARGIDVDDITHVFNFDLPNIPESYVHRIGRTARAGRSGVAISFCDMTEGEYLRDIESTIGMKLSVDDDHSWHSNEAEDAASKPTPKPKPKPKRSPRRRGSNRGAPPRRSGGRGDASGQRAKPATPSGGRRNSGSRGSRNRPPKPGGVKRSGSPRSDRRGPRDGARKGKSSGRGGASGA